MNWDKKDFINICKVVAFGIILYWILNNIGMFGNAFGTLCSILAPFIGGGCDSFCYKYTYDNFREKGIYKKKKSKKEKK